MDTVAIIYELVGIFVLNIFQKFQIPTLENLLKMKRDGTYVPPVTVKVCGVSAEKQYVNQSGEEKRLVYVGVADSTMTVKFTVYDQEKLQHGSWDYCYVDEHNCQARQFHQHN